MTDPTTGRPERPIRAPRGTALSCKGWPQEAALRMLMNNLDPDVAERWEDLVVYGGSGKAARNWEAYHRIVASLRSLEADETLLVQSGKADWPILNALLNTAAGATWVSVHHGGGVGIGYSIHAGMVVVADGTPDAARRLERVLTTDPGTGIMRHADAGYPEAIDAARRHGLNLPGVTRP